MASITGTLAVTLPLVETVEIGAEGSSVNKGTAAISLHVRAAGVGAAGNTGGTMSATLPRLSTSSVGAVGAGMNQGVLAVTQRLISTYFYTAREMDGSLAVLLPLLAVDIAGVRVDPSMITNSGTMTVHLPKVAAVAAGVETHVDAPFIVAHQSMVRKGSSVLLYFTGPAFRAVTWSVTSGGGTVTALQPYTDVNGQAQATYSSGTYEGDVQIQVDYGA